ncbi:MAG: hypothetical protein H6Q74_1749 [Firmicutes bacterium]|nr:hypothetical protein [Bacillota bacterium]
MVVKFIRISIVAILLATFGATASVNAQENFKLIHSDDVSSFYIDTTRMQFFSKSKICDIWVKKVFIDNGKEKSSELNKSKKRDKKARTKGNKNLSYVLIHEQFDAANFKYKIVEVASFDDGGRMVSQDTTQASWSDICPGSIEDKSLSMVDSYIESSIDQVIVR